MTPARTCGECIHWLGSSRSYVAGCALLMLTGAVEFDRPCDWCAEFTDRARLVSADIRQQSAARGDVGNLARQMQGGKP